jgi:large subunit ribosomal protein L13
MIFALPAGSWWDALALERVRTKEHEHSGTLEQLVKVEMDTYFQTAENAEASRKWFIVDAQGKTLGRLASEVAVLLRGKHKPTFTPHNDGGDYVVVINASQVVLTGNKLEDKMHKYHTGYIGGIKRVPAGVILQKNPPKLLKLAVWGMLPKGPLGRRIFKKLKVYPGVEHPHAAQRPQAYETKYL